MPKPKSFCTLDGCDEPHHGRGMCYGHYRRWLIHGDPYGGRKTPRTFASFEAAFDAYADRSDDCWLWTGPLWGEYGRIHVGGEAVLAHRWSYEHHVGPIPDGLTIDHVAERGCTSKLCVNPAHLEPVTQGENNRRFHRGKTHCVHGHEFTPENTYTNPSGSRACRECQRQRDRRRRAAALDRTDR